MRDLPTKVRNQMTLSNQHHYSSPPKISSTLSQEKKKEIKFLLYMVGLLYQNPKRKILLEISVRWSHTTCWDYRHCEKCQTKEPTHSSKYYPSPLDLLQIKNSNVHKETTEIIEENEIVIFVISRWGKPLLHIADFRCLKGKRFDDKRKSFI